MIKSKKGDGLSMNVIIIAILALLVLVVLTLIFVKQMDKYGTQTDAVCLTMGVGAKCVDASESCPSDSTTYASGNSKNLKFTDCSFNDNKKCCVPNSK